MYIAACQGQTTPGDKILMSTETTCHFGHLLQVSKQSLSSLILYIFFHNLIHVYSSGAGVDSPQGATFWCQQKGLITLPICCKFQRNLFEVWFYTYFFFHDLIHIYSPRAGGIQLLGDKDLMSTETSCHFGHLLLVSNHRLPQFLKNHSSLFNCTPVGRESDSMMAPT